MFVGVDAAGNSAPETIIENITFDNDPPSISIEEPNSRTFFIAQSFVYSF